METEDLSMVEIPDRKAKPFRPGEGVIHGYYQKSQPAEAVLAVLAEDIQGVEEQIGGLRLLARGLIPAQKFSEFQFTPARIGQGPKSAE